MNSQGSAVVVHPSVGTSPLRAEHGREFDPDEAGFTYALVKSGPSVDADEVESHAWVVEVVVLWGRNVLHVSHLPPSRPFCVGEDVGSEGGCDYFVPTGELGMRRAPIVLSRGLSAAVVILPGCQGHVDVPRIGRVTLADLVTSGRARPSTEIPGAYEYDLPPEARAHLELARSALVFEVAAVNAGKRFPVGFPATAEPAALFYTGLSLLAHAGLVVVLAFFMPGMRQDDGDAMDRDRMATMQKLLNAAAEREEERDTHESAETPHEDREGGTGARASGSEGSAGAPTTKETGRRYAVQGPRDNPDPHLAKLAAIQEAAQFGMIGLLATLGGGDPNAPTAVWGRDESLGRDEASARGSVFGDTIGDAAGVGGLGVSGREEGGGGVAESIGIGDFGTLGHGAGTGSRDGLGHGRGQLNGAHPYRAPRVREENTVVSGRLRPEVVQRIIRQNFGRFRLCYENGMRGNPNLAGRVTVKFIIDRSGRVMTAGDGGSDLPDQAVVRCVVTGFTNLSFPEPEGGMVTVVYPIAFTPS